MKTHEKPSKLRPREPLGILAPPLGTSQRSLRTALEHLETRQVHLWTPRGFLATPLDDSGCLGGVSARLGGILRHPRLYLVPGPFIRQPKAPPGAIRGVPQDLQGPPRDPPGTPKRPPCLQFFKT